MLLPVGTVSVFGLLHGMTSFNKWKVYWSAITGVTVVSWLSTSRSLLSANAFKSFVLTVLLTVILLPSACLFSLSSFEVLFRLL